MVAKTKSEKFSAVSVSEIPAGLENGLLNYWYPLLLSENLKPNKIIGIQRLGEELVIWRSQDGKPHLFADYCPHKGARLSLGQMTEQGRLLCIYHGLEFDETGQCRRIPADRADDGPLTKRICVKSYPCEEQAGFIWGYIGDVEKFPPPSLQMEPSIVDGNYYVEPFDLDYEWEASWPLVMDNNSDASHAPFLHRKSSEGFIPPEQILNYFTPVESRFEEVEGDIRLGGTRGQNILFYNGDVDVQNFFLPHSHRLDVGLGPGFEEGDLRLLVYLTPINAERTLYFHHVCGKKSSLPDEHTWKKIYQEKVDPGLRAIYKEDVDITISQRSTKLARANERLLPQDTMATQVRRLILKAYQAQQSAC